MKHFKFVSLSILLCVVLCNCNSNKPEDLVMDAMLEEILEDYCIKHPRIGGNPDEGEWFCSFEVYGRRKIPGKFEIYLWVYCTEYHLVKGRLTEGGGSSLPAAITLKKKNRDSYQVIGCKVPSDGEAYGKHIREIFPKYVQYKILPEDVSKSNQRSRRLEEKALAKAREYFLTKNLELSD